jgi:hypothetical protein
MCSPIGLIQFSLRFNQPHELSLQSSDSSTEVRREEKLHRTHSGDITPELTGRSKKHSTYVQSFDDEKHSIRAPVE